jgi:hypothetical protein
MSAGPPAPDPPAPDTTLRSDPARRVGRVLVWPFVAWAAVGAGACLALLTVFTVGVFILPVVIAAAIALLRWRGSRTIAAIGVISGFGLVPLYVAYLNRGGPGDVCTTSGGGQSCLTEWSPWPWFIAGAVMVALGIAVFAGVRNAISPLSAGPGRPPPPPGRS